MAGRQEAGWRFSTLYLVKDGLGVMLAAAGLMEDALREFFELEATYLEALASGGALAGADFGAASVKTSIAELTSNAEWHLIADLRSLRACCPMSGVSIILCTDCPVQRSTSCLIGHKACAVKFKADVVS